MNRHFNAPRRSGLGGRLIAAAAVVVGLTGVAQASTHRSDERTVIVHTHDLDLATPAGLIELNARLDRAAHRVCKAAVPVDTIAKLPIRRCVRRVVYAQRGKVRELVLAAQRRGNIRLAAGRVPMIAS